MRAWAWAVLYGDPATGCRGGTAGCRNTQRGGLGIVALEGRRGASCANPRPTMRGCGGWSSNPKAGTEIPEPTSVARTMSVPPAVPPKSVLRSWCSSGKTPGGRRPGPTSMAGKVSAPCCPCRKPLPPLLIVDKPHRDRKADLRGTVDLGATCPCLRSGLRPSLQPGQRVIPVNLFLNPDSHSTWYRKGGQVTHRCRETTFAFHTQQQARLDVGSGVRKSRIVAIEA